MADEAFADDILGELLEEAAVAAAESGQRTNMGRLTYGPTIYLKWENKMPSEVDLATYKTLNPRNRGAKLNIRVDVQELNPDLEWTYERRIDVNSADWFAHWQKSIIEVFGLEDEVDEAIRGKERQIAVGKLAAQKMKELEGRYVLLDDVPQEKQKDPNKVYRTPELVEVYESREACLAAYEARFGRAPTGATASAQKVPEGFSSYQEFRDTVAMLRNDQMTNREISEQLGVSLLSVAGVK